MKNIAENIKQIREQIPENVALIAVSKLKPLSAVKEAYEAGQQLFGENRTIKNDVSK